MQEFLFVLALSALPVISNFIGAMIYPVALNFNETLRSKDAYYE
jgi:hypothetical protein